MEWLLDSARRRFSRWPLIALGAIAMMCAMPAIGRAAVSVVNLRCESKSSPLGIDVVIPRLSWQLQSDQRGAMQSAYEVRVASSATILRSGQGDLWDSGKVAGDQSINVEYAGKPLTSGMQCFWNVTVWDQNGNEAISAPTTWEMGLLQPQDWTAKWIDVTQSQPKPPATAPTTLPTTKPSKTVHYPPNVPPFLRKEFMINGEIKRARLYATALGLYDFWINGQRVSDIVLTPDWTDYHKRVRYQTYDVTNLLQRGTNAAGAVLGDGWYAGHVGMLPGHVYGERPALLAQIVIDYADGTREVVGTDATWRTALGPLLKSDLLDGEDYDARKEFSGWTEAGFDDFPWAAVEVRDEHPLLEAQIGPPVRKTQELAVKAVTEPKPGHLVYDLGQNMVGFVRLKVNGERGTKLTLRFAEMLNPDGTIYTENLRGAKATDTYTLKGGEETWEPSFTFHGFRYVELTGYPGQPPPGIITGVVIGSDNHSTGQWECSDPLLNQLQSNIVWGQRGNFVSVPTDCPQRDERLGWMGDAEVFIRTATFNYDVQEFFNNWLVDVSDAQGANGAYSDVSPRVLGGEGVAAWADAGVICPWTLYEVYGDTRIISRQYDSMAKYIKYLQNHSDGLIRPATGYGDWLSIGADTPKDVIATAYFAYSTHLMAKMAKIIGKNDDAAKYQKLFEDIRKAFNDKFVSADGKITGDTQTCYLMALKFELLDEAHRQQAAKRLAQDIEAKNWHLSTGFIGVSFILPMLTQYGNLDIAYRLLNQTTFPSWLFSVKQGATTIWERWDGWTPDKGFQTPKMNSFNHYSLGSCGEWMYDTIGGIGLDPEHPGFKHIIIHPRPGGNLTWAKASYDSQFGPIKTDWKIEGGAMTLAVTIPANTTATVYLPGANIANITEENVAAASAPGVKAVAEGTGVFEIGSGDYLFKAPYP